MPASCRWLTGPGRQRWRRPAGTAIRWSVPFRLPARAAPGRGRRTGPAMSIEGACKADVTARGKRRQLRGPGGRSGAVQVGAQSCCALFPFVGKSEPRNSHRGRRPTSDNPKQQHKSERLEKRRSGRRRFEFFRVRIFALFRDSNFGFRICTIVRILREISRVSEYYPGAADCALPSEGGAFKRRRPLLPGRDDLADVSSRLTEMSHDG